MSNANRPLPSSALVDEEIAEIESAVSAKLERAGIKAGSIHHELLKEQYTRRAVRHVDGTLGIMVEYPIVADDKNADAMSRFFDWTKGNAKFLPLQDALDLLCSKKSPELELMRRRRAHDDEQRRGAVRTHYENLDRLDREAAENLERERVGAWRTLSPAKRAGIRLRGLVFDAVQYVDALDAESQPMSMPPADWIATPDLLTAASAAATPKPERNLFKQVGQAPPPRVTGD